MNPAELYNTIESTFRLIDHALTAGIFTALGAVALVLAVREVGSALRFRARYL